MSSDNNTPKAPEGYFLRVTPYFDRRGQDNPAFVNVQLRKKGRYFGSSLVSKEDCVWAREEEIRSIMRKLIDGLQWKLGSAAREAEKARERDKFVGDYPPKRL